MYNSIYDKEKARALYLKYFFTITQSAYIWEGLPDSIPAEELEKILQTTGSAFITSVGGTLYALQASPAGLPDVYGNPTAVILNNTALNINKIISIRDGVLLKNDFYAVGFKPTFEKYTNLLIEGFITLNTAVILERMHTIISASDQNTKESGEEYLKKIERGELGIIGESAFLKGIETHGGGASAYNLSQTIETITFYKAGLLNAIGLKANYNMKRERLNTAEIAINDEALYPYIDNTLKERQAGAAAINKKYGLNCRVDFGGIWKISKETKEREAAVINTPTEDERAQGLEPAAAMVDTEAPEDNEQNKK